MPAPHAVNRIQPGSFLTLHYRLAGPDGVDVINTFGDKPATLRSGEFVVRQRLRDVAEEWVVVARTGTADPDAEAARALQAFLSRVTRGRPWPTSGRWPLTGSCGNWIRLSNHQTHHRENEQWNRFTT